MPVPDEQGAGREEKASGRAEGKGEAHLASLVPLGAKQSQNQKERQPQTLPAAADEEPHSGKFLSKTKTKQKPNKMVV